MNKTELRMQARKSLDDFVDPAWKVYLEIVKQAKKEYDEVTRPAQEKYKETLKEINRAGTDIPVPT